MSNTDKTQMLELDDLDLMLARELELDARQSIRVLARKLAVSETTVKRRFKRLLDEEVITIATIPSSILSALMTGAVIGLNVSPGKVDEVVECLRPCKRVQRIILTSGRYDMVISTNLSNLCELTDLSDGELSNVPHLINTEKIMFLERVKSSWKYLNSDTDRHRQPTLRELDELDRRLIKELELCPREGVKNLGKKLGVNRKLISRKLQSLLADNIIQVVSLAKPSLFGLNMHVFILVKVKLGKVRSVANSLTAESRVRHICIITGPFDLFLNAAFRDLEELSDFLRNHLGNYPGIVSYETLIQLAFPKRSYSLLA